jgi:hypothetical protein
VQILIKAKVDLNMAFDGIPALHYAIKAQEINIVADMLNARETLLGLKANLYQANLWGVTPLMAYFIKFDPQRSSIPNSFLIHDANLNLRNVNGITALMYCVASAPEYLSFYMRQPVQRLMEFHPNAHFRSNKNIGMPQIPPSFSESDKQKILARHQEFISTTKQKLLGLTALEIVNQTWSNSSETWAIERLLKAEMKQYPLIPETAPPPFQAEPSAPEMTPVPSRQNSTASLSVPAYQSATGNMREKQEESILDRLFGSFRM